MDGPNLIINLILAYIWLIRSNLFLSFLDFICEGQQANFIKISHVLKISEEKTKQINCLNPKAYVDPT